MSILEMGSHALQNTLLAMIPALGFAMLFNVPRRALKYCALGGGIAYLVRYCFLVVNFPIEWATLCASCTVGAFAVFLAHRFLMHPKTFTVAAMIPLVPGKFALSAIIALAEINYRGFNLELWGNFVESAIKTILILATLSIGLSMPGLLFYRRHAIV